MPWLWKNKVETNTTPNSQKVIDLKSLTFQELWNAYPSNKIKHAGDFPDKNGKLVYMDDGFDDHCAIHLSDALLAVGIKMKSFPKERRCYGSCNRNHMHALAAQDLANWLEKKPFPNCPKVQKFTGTNFEENVDGKKGIIFFKDYWIDNGARTGDHIDLWNKNESASDGYFKTLVRMSVPETLETVSGFLGDNTRISNFKRAKEVLFWEIK